VSKTNMQGMQILEPITFEEWERNVLPKFGSELRSTIQGNPQLLSYLKGVIAFVAVNPAILNKNLSMPANEITDPQMSKLKMRYYRVPLANMASKLYDATMLVEDAESYLMPVSNVITPFANGIMSGNMESGSVISTMGGGSYGPNNSFKMMSKQLLELFMDLRKNGLTISEDDMSAIKKQLNKLDNTETKIRELIKVLRTLVNLQNFVRCFDSKQGEYGVDGGELSLERAMNNRQLLKYLSENSGDYERSIYRNMETMSAGTNEILRSYKQLLGSITTNGNKNYKPL